MYLSAVLPFQPSTEGLDKSCQEYPPHQLHAAGYYCENELLPLYTPTIYNDKLQSLGVPTS